MCVWRLFNSIAFLSIFFVISVFACPNQIMIIRHGEKPQSGSDLTDIGWARANLLPTVILPSNINFVAAGQTSSNRSVETCTPIAKAMNGNAPFSQFAIGQEQQMANYVLANTSGNILICWEHDHIPSLVQDLGGTLSPWPSDDFDSIVTLPCQSSGNICNCGPASLSKEGLIATLQKDVSDYPDNPKWTGPTYNMNVAKKNDFDALMCENPADPWTPSC